MCHWFDSRWHHQPKDLQINDLDLQVFLSFWSWQWFCRTSSKKTTQKCFKVFHCVSLGFAVFAQKFVHRVSGSLAMANLKLYLDGRRLKADGTALLKISLSHLRQVRYVSLGLSLKPCMWDSERCRVTDKHPSHLLRYFISFIIDCEISDFTRICQAIF